MLYSGVSFDMMRPASQQEAGQYKALPRGGVPERPKGADCKSAVIDFEGSNPSPTTISSITSKFELPLVGFPSGQREQTVNLPSSTSKVRILPPPPLFPESTQTTFNNLAPYSALTGKDEKLRLRFDSSGSEKALPKATTRRARRNAPSNPSPTTITYLLHPSQIKFLYSIFCPVALRLPGLHDYICPIVGRIRRSRHPADRHKKTCQSRV